MKNKQGLLVLGGLGVLVLLLINQTPSGTGTSGSGTSGSGTSGSGTSGSGTSGSGPSGTLCGRPGFAPCRPGGCRNCANPLVYP